MRRFRFIAARTGFGLLFLGLTFLQLISFPGQYQHMRRVQGISLVFEIALTLTVGLWLFCGQCALFCLWHIVDLMQKDQFYSRNTLVWINRLLLAFKGATVIPIILALMIAPQADDPGFLIIVFIVALFIFSLTAVTTLLKEQIGNKIIAP